MPKSLEQAVQNCVNSGHTSVQCNEWTFRHLNEITRSHASRQCDKMCVTGGDRDELCLDICSVLRDFRERTK